MNLKYAFLSIKGINLRPNNKFTGSAIRGCLGYALRKVVCPFPNDSCNKCIRNYKCVFYKIYENTNTPPNIRLELGQNSYDFKLFMFEDIVEFIPYFIVAFENMQDIGFGYKRKKFELDKILLNGKVIYENKVLLDRNFRSLAFKPNFKENNILVKFTSPLRLKQNDKFITNSLDLTHFLRSIKRRYNVIKNIDEKVNYTPKFSHFKSNLKPDSFERFSNRQKKKHEFGGSVGEIEIYNLDDEGVKLLELATIIGVGKSVAFGLGSIELHYI